MIGGILKRARTLACDLLAAVPREVAAADLDDARRRWSGEVCGLQILRDQLSAERDRAMDQVQRLEAALSAEQAQVAKLRAAETELRELQDQALSRAREDGRALELAARGVCAALEDDLLGPRQTSNLRNLRHVLGMVP